MVACWTDTTFQLALVHQHDVALLTFKTELTIKIDFYNPMHFLIHGVPSSNPRNNIPPSCYSNHTCHDIVFSWQFSIVDEEQLLNNYWRTVIKGLLQLKSAIKTLIAVLVPYHDDTGKRCPHALTVWTKAENTVVIVKLYKPWTASIWTIESVIPTEPPKVRKTPVISYYPSSLQSS